MTLNGQSGAPLHLGGANTEDITSCIQVWRGETIRLPYRWLLKSCYSFGRHRCFCLYYLPLQQMGVSWLERNVVYQWKKWFINSIPYSSIDRKS